MPVTPSLHELNRGPEQTNYSALGTLVTVFFFWGFIAAGNNIFIPFCKNYFSLDQFQSQLIDFAFYTAYFIGSFFLFTISIWKKEDLIGKWGYRSSIIRGLLFSTIGAVVMILSVKMNLYSVMLMGLFILALGFSLQQIAANPFALQLGPPESGNSRINFGGAINSIGTMLGPVLLAFALYGSTEKITDEMISSLKLDKVILLYALVGSLFIIAAALFYFSKNIVDFKRDFKIIDAKKSWISLTIMTLLVALFFSFIFSTYNESSTIVEKENFRLFFLILSILTIMGTLSIAGYSAKKNEIGWGALKHPQLIWGMLAIFIYVGVEVGIGSNLSDLLSMEKFGSMSSSEATPYVSMYWGSLMIGRWVGSLNVFNINPKSTLVLTIIVPYLAFGLILLSNHLAGYDVTALYGYSILILVQIIAFIWSKNKPIKTLYTFGILGMTFIFIGIMTSGKISLYSFVSGGLFCSIMWPAIFQLSLAGLGKYTNQGASFLIMMIIGGGIIPPMQGKIADIWNTNYSYFVSVACFAFIVIFSFQIKKILLKLGIEYDK